jgi:hypothetical protein
MLLSETIRDLARDRPRRSALLLAAVTLLAVAALSSLSSKAESAPSSAPAPALLLVAPPATSKTATTSSSRPATPAACTKAANNAKSATSDNNNKSAMGLLGGPTAGDPEASRAAALFAVSQLQGNSAFPKQGALSLARIVSAQRQVVAGTNHILVLETKDAAGATRTVRATVWEKLPGASASARNDGAAAPRDMELTKFSLEEAGPAAEGVECPPSSSSSSWEDAAARAAVDGINARSNGLVPYELAAVLDAKPAAGGAGAGAATASHELRLRLKRGDKSETFRVSVKEKAAGGAAGVGAAAGGGSPSTFGLVSFAHEP